MKSSLDNPETAAVLALMRGRDVPWNHLAGMIEEAGSAVGLLEVMQSPDTPQLFTTDDSRTPVADLVHEMQAWEQDGIQLVTVLDATYPVNLRTVHDRPPLLFVRGELADEDERSVAIVGTRAATEHGLAQARQVARDVVEGGYVVVSGLAAGVDTAAHMATIEAGGRTVAVIGTGHGHAFPKKNAALQERLGRESAVLSQFWPDQGPRPWTFPQRNAVMSGFARATVVIEASHTSGAKMQARLALEHGRPVFLMRSLLEHHWAREYQNRAGTHVVDDAHEIVELLDRLYSDELTLAP